MIAVVTDAQLLAIAAAFAGGACHSATGFGFALVAAPLVAAALPPETAVSTLLALGILTSALTLATERRMPEPLWAEAAWLLAWGTAGAVAGASLLARLDRTALQLLVTATVLVALAAQLAAARNARSTRKGAGHDPTWKAESRKLRAKGSDPFRSGAAGLAAGALTTSTTANGPPLLLYLLGRGLSAVHVRDTLSVLFVAFGVIGLAAIALGAPDLALAQTDVVAALAAAAAAGHVAGRPLFARLASGRYEQTVAALLLVSVVTGAVLALR